MPAAGARFLPCVRPSRLLVASPATRWSRSTSSPTSNASKYWKRVILNQNQEKASPCPSFAMRAGHGEKSSNNLECSLPSELPPLFHLLLQAQRRWQSRRLNRLFPQGRALTRTISLPASVYAHSSMAVARSPSSAAHAHSLR